MLPQKYDPPDATSPVDPRSARPCSTACETFDIDCRSGVDGAEAASVSGARLPRLLGPTLSAAMPNANRPSRAPLSWSLGAVKIRVQAIGRNPPETVYGQAGRESSTRGIRCT